MLAPSCVYTGGGTTEGRAAAKIINELLKYVAKL